MNQALKMAILYNLDLSAVDSRWLAAVENPTHPRLRQGLKYYVVALKCKSRKS